MMNKIFYLFWQSLLYLLKNLKFSGVALNYGIMEGQTNSVQALLDNNTDLSTKDIHGDTLL